MGNDFQRQRNVPRISMSGPTMRNNSQPLHFHQVHGDNIRIYRNGTVAVRPVGFSKGLVFSDRPIMIGEPVYIKFLEISTNWSGTLRIGFTSHDPNSMRNRLPNYAFPLTSIIGNWAKMVPEQHATKNSILYYYCDQNGDVHFGVNGEYLGIFFRGVNTFGKLWSILDVYGHTVAIELTGPNAKATCDDSDDSAALIVNNTTHSSPSMFKMMAYIPILFHSIHGRNVSLKSYRRVAVRKSGYFHLAYVFTERPLKLGEQICLDILQTTPISHGIFSYGMTCCNPATLNPNDLPENPEELMDRPEYWVVRYDTNYYASGDSIVFSTDIKGEITTIKNFGRQTEKFFVDPAQPLWLFFCLSGTVAEVQVVGTPVKDEESEHASSLECLNDIMPLESARKRSSDMQTVTECVICSKEPVNCALYRCGHMCLCYNCALKRFKLNAHVICPICKENVQDVIKIYP